MTNFAGAFAEGAPAGSSKSRELAEAHRQYLERWFYPCGARMHRGLADLLGKLIDLVIMVTLRGREREEDEFRKLFASAGLSIRHILPTRSPRKIIEAVIA